jgi:O-methyltransferase involved in polyketide biosynthesis
VKEEEIKALFKAFSNTFSKSIVIFDCYSELTAKGIKNHPSIKKTGAVIHWGVDNAKDIESWGDNIHLIEEWHFTQSDDLDKLDPGYRFLFKIMGLFPIAKKAHRIVVVQLGT